MKRIKSIFIVVFNLSIAAQCFAWPRPCYSGNDSLTDGCISVEWHDNGSSFTCFKANCDISTNFHRLYIRFDSAGTGIVRMFLIDVSGQVILNFEDNQIVYDELGIFGSPGFIELAKGKKLKADFRDHYMNSDGDKFSYNYSRNKESVTFECLISLAEEVMDESSKLVRISWSAKEKKVLQLIYGRDLKHWQQLR